MGGLKLTALIFWLNVGKAPQNQEHQRDYRCCALKITSFFEKLYRFLDKTL